MKKNHYSTIKCISLIIFTLSILISCNNSSENKLVYIENDTIKDVVKNKEQNITWTFEIEPERLSKDISKNVWETGENIPYTPDFLRLYKTFQKPVFPELNDFGSLDTSSLKGKTKERLNNFCTKLSESYAADAASYFSGKYLFSYVFFRKELEDGWKNNFKNDFPIIEKTSDKEEEEKKEIKPIFEKWIFGEPFNSSEILQVPVRFYCNYGTIDVTIYMNPNGNNEFYQITIDRWVKV